MQSKYFLLLVFLVLGFVSAEEKNHKKRQIYREQVLPHAGGRIPDTAFQSDRLFLNQLQKDGISVPDGIVPQQRNPQVYPFLNKSQRTVYRVALSSDGRYTPNEGRYHHQVAPSVETTYLYPQIHGQKNRTPPKMPVFPVYKQFQIHNNQLNQVKLQPKKKAQTLNITPSTTTSGGAKNSRLKSYKAESYQNVNIINTPLAPTLSTAGYHYLPESYESSHLFNEFDDLFNNFEIGRTSGSSSSTFHGKSSAKAHPIQVLRY